MGICESRLSTIKALKSKFAVLLPLVYCWFETSYRAAQAVCLSPRSVAQACLKPTPHLPVSTLSSFSIVSLRSKDIFVVI